MQRIVTLSKLFLSAALVLLWSASSVHAQAAAKPVTVKFAMAGPGADYLPLYVGRDKGYFQRENLDIADYTLTGDKMAPSLISGSVNIASYGPGPFILAIEKGAPIKIFMGHANLPVYSLMVRPDINSYADLKGKRIGVAFLKAAEVYFLRKMMAPHGIQERDYILIQTGAPGERVAALVAGSVSATFVPPTLDQKLVDEGYKRLDVTANVIERYAWNSQHVREDWAATNRPTMLAFIRAWIRATRWVYDPANKGESIKMLAKELKLEERYARRVYELYFESKNVTLAKDGELDIGGVQAVIDFTAEQGDLKPPFSRAEKYVDLSYWREAIKSIR